MYFQAERYYSREAYAVYSKSRCSWYKVLNCEVISLKITFFNAKIKITRTILFNKIYYVDRYMLKQ